MLERPRNPRQPNRSWWSALLVAFALTLAGCGGGGGGDSGMVAPPPPPPPPTAGTDQPLVDSTIYSSQPGASLATATDAAAVTHHQIVVGGATLSYTATTGHLVARDLTSNAPQA